MWKYIEHLKAEIYNYKRYEIFKLSGLTYLDLPSVAKIENEAFFRSRIRGLKLENCKEFEEEALSNCFSLELTQKEVLVGCQNLALQLHQLLKISYYVQ